MYLSIENPSRWNSKGTPKFEKKTRSIEKLHWMENKGANS